MTPASKIKLTDLLEMYPAVLPDFIPKNGSTLQFWSMKGPTPVKKLSAKAQTENIIAAHKAHAVQQAELVSRIQETNRELTKGNQSLQDQLSRALTEKSQAQASIALFKQEALQAAVTIAELRGYIGRTLEDDAVREPVQPDMAPGELPDFERNHMHQLLAQDQQARSQPRQPRRTGPSAMHPMGAVVADRNWSHDEMNRMFRSGSISSAPKEPLHWLSR